VIDPTVQAKMLAEYEQQLGTYQDLAVTVTALLGRMLQSPNLQLHSITQRCKSRDSLAGKLAKPEKDYASLADVTDLAAVRVTTYFAEDVDRVAQVVEREFEIDRANSIDKRKLLDPDRFGYQSLHYVASLTPQGCGLVEYNRFSKKRFEIQVRSILQHAWAEIEHDLGYKSAAGIPQELRRRFSRIAGLLELADDEFSAIRRDLASYAASIPNAIRKQPETVGIDKISLHSLVSSPESALRRLSQTIASAAGAELEPTTDTILEKNVANLNFLEIQTVAELESAAAAHEAVVAEFAKRWLEGSTHRRLHEGIGILYLAYVLLAERGDGDRILRFLREGSIGVSHERAEIVRRILSTYQAVTGKR